GRIRKRSASFKMTPVSPCAPSPSMYSDQPTIPSSVVTLRNELTRQPASQCRSSTLTIFMGNLLDNANSRYQKDAGAPKQHCLTIGRPVRISARSAGFARERRLVDDPPLPVGVAAGGPIYRGSATSV